MLQTEERYSPYCTVNNDGSYRFSALHKNNPAGSVGSEMTHITVSGDLTSRSLDRSELLRHALHNDDPPHAEQLAHADDPVHTYAPQYTNTRSDGIDQLRQALLRSKQREAESLALLEATRAVLRSASLEHAARRVFDFCRRMLNVRMGYVAISRGQETDDEALVFDTGDHTMNILRDLPTSARGLKAIAYWCKKPVYQNDINKSSAFLDNLLFVPLVTDNTTLGMMCLANRTGGFEEKDTLLASSFGEIAAMALQRSIDLENLKHNEERFRSVVETATDAIISIDSNGRICFINSSSCKMFGYRQTEVIGKPLSLLLPDSHRRKRSKQIKMDCMVGNTVETVGLRKDGSHFPIELSISSFQCKEGVCYSGFIRNITNRRLNQ